MEWLNFHRNRPVPSYMGTWCVQVLARNRNYHPTKRRTCPAPDRRLHEYTRIPACIIAALVVRSMHILCSHYSLAGVPTEPLDLDIRPLTLSRALKSLRGSVYTGTQGKLFRCRNILIVLRLQTL